MKRLFLMMGQPGSGKSTFIKEHQHKLVGSTLVVSRDAVRFSMVKEDEPYFSKEKQVFQEFARQVNEGLSTADNVIVDATHISRASRTKLLRRVKPKSYDELIIIWIKTSLEKTLAQNNLRKGTRAFVPESAIHRMFSQVEAPDFDEGFTSIYEVENNVISIRKKA